MKQSKREKWSDGYKEPPQIVKKKQMVELMKYLSKVFPSVDTMTSKQKRLMRRGFRIAEAHRISAHDMRLFTKLLHRAGMLDKLIEDIRAGRNPEERPVLPKFEDALSDMPNENKGS